MFARAIIREERSRSRDREKPLARCIVRPCTGEGRIEQCILGDEQREAIESVEKNDSREREREIKRKRRGRMRRHGRMWSNEYGEPIYMHLQGLPVGHYTLVCVFSLYAYYDRLSPIPAVQWSIATNSTKARLPEAALCRCSSTNEPHKNKRQVCSK